MRRNGSRSATIRDPCGSSKAAKAQTPSPPRNLKTKSIDSVKSIALSVLLSLSLLMSAWPLPPAQTPADYFHMGVTNYCRTNIAQARKDVTNGLTLYPNNPWLTNLWELLNRSEQQQKQQQEDKDKDKDKDQESKDQQSKDQQQQDQQKQDQQKQDEQKKKEE